MSWPTSAHPQHLVRVIYMRAPFLRLSQCSSGLYVDWHTRTESVEFRSKEYVHHASFAGLKKGELAHVDGFSLHDVISAVELMDPKMDIGMAIHRHGRPDISTLADAYEVGYDAHARHHHHRLFQIKERVTRPTFCGYWHRLDYRVHTSQGQPFSESWISFSLASQAG